MKRPSRIEEEALVRFTCGLVQAPSVLGNEKQVAQLVRAEMQSAGYDPIHIDSLGNVTGVIQGAEPGPTLLIDAHMDTVDVHPRGSWTHEPFGGEARQGKIFGRGTSDMKGALAAMVHGIGSLDKNLLHGTVVVSATVGEESIEGEALRPVVERYRPDFVIIGEASDLAIVRAGRGRAEFELVTTGRPAHASTPHLGRNAVLQMVRLIREIEEIPMPAHPFVGNGVMCLTDMISAPYPAQSVVPSACRATYERRLVPGESLQRVVEDLREASVRAGTEEVRINLVQARYQTYTGQQMERIKWLAPWELAEEHDLVRRSLAALEGVGLEARLSSYQFCTNAAFTAGEAGIPTIGFGPSTEQLAHTVDESVDIESLLKAATGYRALAESILTGH